MNKALINETPLVSVLMCVYEEPVEWVKQSVNSILHQTFVNFEFIIIIDNPHANVQRELLYQYANNDTRIRLIENNKNLGLTKSLNIGLRQCKGKYVARMDADDWSYPERLEKQYLFMECNSNLIASSALAYSWNGYSKLKPIYRPIHYSEIIPYTFTSSPFIHPLLILRLESLRINKIEYDENYNRSQDYKLAIDLLEFGKIENLNQYLLKYRISNQQITSKYGNEQEIICKSIRRIYVNWYYKQHNIIGLSKEITLEDIINNYSAEKAYKHDFKPPEEISKLFYKSMNNIRRILYYSISDYSIKSFLRFLWSGDYLRYPYNLRRFLIIVLKHIKKDIVPKLI